MCLMCDGKLEMIQLSIVANTEQQIEIKLAK